MNLFWIYYLRLSQVGRIHLVLTNLKPHHLKILYYYLFVQSNLFILHFKDNFILYFIAPTVNLIFKSFHKMRPIFYYCFN